MVKLFKIRFELVAEATISVVMDSGTFQPLGEDELKALAIAKAKNTRADWECKDYEAKEFSPSPES